MYSIIIKKNVENTHKKPTVLRFDTRREALNTWDDVMDSLIPGSKAQLLDGDSHVLSEYTPSESSWRNA